MRLWSLHPSALDRMGLLALWREGLLAQKVLLGQTKGYRSHPQLKRFQATKDPAATIGTYLAGRRQGGRSEGVLFRCVQDRQEAAIHFHSGYKRPNGV